MKLLVLMNSSGISVTDGKSTPINVTSDHPNFERIMECVKSDDATIKDLTDLIDIKKALSYKDDFIEVVVTDNDIEIKVKGKKKQYIDDSIKHRIISTLKECSDISDFSMNIFGKFLSRLYQNPSYKVVSQLYKFLEVNNIPLTSEGTFYAYKKVDYDYYDLYSHTNKNTIGAVITMDRNEVEDDPTKTCSYGLHVCSKNYLPHFGKHDPTISRVVIVEIDPVDVVSVPYDYNNAKMRVCKYTVVDEITDFDVSLSSYFIGNHKKGWIKETVEKVATMYKEFWNIKDSEVFEWEYIKSREKYLTEAVCEKFVEKVSSTFGDWIYGIESDDIDELALSPKKIFDHLAHHDENALTAPPSDSNSEKKANESTEENLPF